MKIGFDKKQIRQLNIRGNPRLKIFGNLIMDSLGYINSKTREAYNLAASEYDELFQDELQNKDYDRQLLNDFASKLKSGAFLCDAGCGPSAHIGKYLFDKGFRVVGVDISDKCVELARQTNPEIKLGMGDIGCLPFKNNTFDGVISYYSIIDTPKKYIENIFIEFKRVLKPGGLLLVVVKAGTFAGFMQELLGIKTEIYFTQFKEREIAGYFEKTGFSIEFIETRNPYDFEIKNQRIFSIGIK